MPDRTFLRKTLLSESAVRYGVFENKKNHKKLVYYPCAKNANSSAKLFFAKHLGIENKFYFSEDKIPRYKQTKNETEKKNLINFLPNYSPFTVVDVDFKCCIVRDPIERFVSAYKNRILFHKDKQFKDHTIDMILEKIESGLYENRHFLPQTYFLGDNLDYYTFYSDIKNISYFEKKVNEFFKKKIKFPKIQTGGHQFGVKLNNQQIDKIYSNDFKLIKEK